VTGFLTSPRWCGSWPTRSGRRSPSDPAALGGPRGAAGARAAHGGRVARLVRPDGSGDADADLRTGRWAEGLPWGVAWIGGRPSPARRRWPGPPMARRPARGPGSSAFWWRRPPGAAASGRPGRGLRGPARRQGFPGAFATTGTARGLLFRRGWRMVRALPDGTTCFIGGWIENGPLGREGRIGSAESRSLRRT
jgi:hypothetical protein